MQPNDDRLRLAYGASLASRRIDPASHPEPEALVAVVERSGSESARLEVLDHVMACGACQRELDIVRASLSAAGMPRQRSWFRSPAAGLMALAAMLLIIAGVRLFMTQSSGDIDVGPRLRGGSGVAVYPASWLANGDAKLAWRPVADAASYRLEVIDEAGSAVVDSTMTRDTTFVVADSLVRNRRGLSWTVTTTLGDGSAVSSLPARLVPPAR